MSTAMFFSLLLGMIIGNLIWMWAKGHLQNTSSEPAPKVKDPAVSKSRLSKREQDDFTMQNLRQAQMIFEASGNPGVSKELKRRIERGTNDTFTTM